MLRTECPGGSFLEVEPATGIVLQTERPRGSFLEMERPTGIVLQTDRLGGVVLLSLSHVQ